MLGTHALIGIGEALITVAALGLHPGASARTSSGCATRQAARRLAPARKEPEHDVADRRGAAAGCGGWSAWRIAALVVIILAPLASPDPDGLERVAEDKGFLSQAPGRALQHPAGLHDPRHRRPDRDHDPGRPRRAGHRVRSWCGALGTAACARRRPHEREGHRWTSIATSPGDSPIHRADARHQVPADGRGDRRDQPAAGRARSSALAARLDRPPGPVRACAGLGAVRG